MLELLDNLTHRDLRVHTERGAAWGDDVMCCPATPAEFRALQAHYPLLFQPDGAGSYLPVALFGLQQGQNLFLGPDGWEAEVLPLAMQRMPFSIGVAGEEMRVMVDMASPRIAHGAGGHAVFLPQGGHSELLENATSVLRTLHEGLQASRGFVQALLAHDLLEPLVLDVQRPDGTRGQLQGFWIIHEEKLAALEPGSVGLLHEADYLQPIYMAIASLSQFAPLIRRHLEREG